jgi:DNA-directed RNA polymerase specialized sigma24 family protein
VRRWDVTDKRHEFSDFYAAARDDCLQIVLVTVGDRQLTEDLVAEAFTRAWASWRTVRRHPAPRAWVVRTALNLSVSWWRRRRREIALGDSDPAAPGGDGGGLDGELLAAVRRLPIRQQQVIVLRVFFGLDAQAAAQELGIAPGTVGVHLHRALATLRAQIPSSAIKEATK